MSDWNLFNPDRATKSRSLISLIYTDYELRKKEKADLDKIVSKIPQNVRTALGINEEAIWDRLRRFGGIEH